jgi:hypothetical protein
MVGMASDGSSTVQQLVWNAVHHHKGLADANGTL